MTASAGSEAGLISDEMQAAVGRQLDRMVSYPVAASDIRRWAVAIYHPEAPPRRFCDGPAGAAPMVAPQEFNPFAWMVADPPRARMGWVPDSPSIEAKLGLPELTTTHMLNGGTEITYGAPMGVGDEITSTTTLSDYQERTGRHGPMLFTLTTAAWTNQHGQLVKRATNTLIRY